MSALAPGGRFGDYLVEGVLGQGGMGVVYRARHERLGRTVALKVMPVHLAGEAEFRDRFADEARTLAAIDSPHIIQVIDHGEHEGALFLATQLVSGGDLSERLAAQGPLPMPLALDIAIQVVEAVADAHRAGVLHRDIKPSNVLLTGAPTRPFAYLCDFGIARNEGAASGHTVMGGVVGTWPYLAPERFDGAPAARATDVYALGCLLWAMLTGQPPYTGTSISVAMSHRQDPVRQLPGSGDLVDGVNDVLATSMAKDPTQRFRTADAMAEALRHVRSTPATSATMTLPPRRYDAPPAPAPAPAPTPAWPPTAHQPPAPPAQPPRSRRGLLAAAAVLVVAIGACAGVLAATSLGDDDPAGRAGATTSTTEPPSSDPVTSSTPASPSTGSPRTTPPETSSPPPSSDPPDPPEPRVVTAFVEGTCPRPDSDCFLSIRSAPDTEADEVAQFLEGESIRVVCRVTGSDYTSSALDTWDQWALTATGNYAAALYLTGSNDLPAC